jgi:hypothetical protein
LNADVIRINKKKNEKGLLAVDDGAKFLSKKTSLNNVFVLIYASQIT